MKRIIVGIDGSPTSREALDEAVRQAQWRDASVLALHVVHMPAVGMYEPASFLDITNEFERVGQGILDAELAALATRHPEDLDVAIESRVVIGHTGHEIVRAASATDDQVTELVVLGSRGLGGFRGLLLGSVTTYVIHHVPCPVLVIPTPTDAEA